MTTHRAEGGRWFIIDDDAPKPNLKEQEGDIEFLQLLEKYRVLSTDMIVKLVSQQRRARTAPKVLEVMDAKRYEARKLRAEKGLPDKKQHEEGYPGAMKRIRKLWKAGLISKPSQQRDFRKAKNSAVVLALTNAGARYLVDQGLADWSRFEMDRNNREIQPVNIQHELLISKVAVCAALGMESQKGVELLASERSFAQKITIYDSKLKRNRSIEPDWWLLFRFADGKHKVLLFEIDRGTETAERTFADGKARGYWIWRNSRRVQAFFNNESVFKKLGVRNLERFQIATVATTPKAIRPENRRNNLARRTKEAANPPHGSHQFIFCTENDFTLDEPESIFAPIFGSARDYDSETNSFKAWHSLVD